MNNHEVIEGENNMSLQEFVEYLYDHYNFYDRLFDEMYWCGGFDAKLAYECTLREADRLGIKLTDIDKFCENELYYLYKDTEKGLS